jgi:hypothetical protein
LNQERGPSALPPGVGVGHIAQSSPKKCSLYFLRHANRHFYKTFLAYLFPKFTDSVEECSPNKICEYLGCTNFSKECMGMNSSKGFHFQFFIIQRTVINTNLSENTPEVQASGKSFFPTILR